MKIKISNWKLLIKVVLAAITMVTFTMTSTAQCADLVVKKNRKFKSASVAYGASFQFEITNRSSTAETFNIAFEDISESCANATFPQVRPNVNLTKQVLSKQGLNKIPNNDITLKAGEVKSFMVKFQIPENTAFDSWSCVKVSAVNAKCRSNAASTTLSIYVPDPSKSE